MNAIRTAHVTPTKMAVTAAALASLTLVPTGCGSSSSDLDGTYYIEEANSTSDLGQLVIEDGALTHHEYGCEGVYDEPDVTSTGEFNDDQTQIVWTVAGDDQRNERTGTESITVSDTSITLDGDVYVREDSDAGVAMLSSFKTSCAE